MDKLPARAGWDWVKQGFALFRRQPAELSTLFMAYLFIMFGLGFIPLIGQVLPLVLVPAFSMTFMQACVTIERGQRVYPRLLTTGFRSPALPTLLKLGVLNLLAALLAIGASALVDGGMFWNVLTGQAQLDPQAAREADMSIAMLFAAAVYTPMAMAFWYAAPLAYWQNMGVAKSVFYSFFSVKRNLAPFMVYGLAWAVIGVIVPTIISVLVALLFGASILAKLLLVPFSIVLTVVLYCSFYPTYTAVFGQPEQPPQEELPSGRSTDQE